MSRKQLTLEMTEVQYARIVIAADNAGLSAAMYFRQAIELLTQISERPGHDLILRKRDSDTAFKIQIPGILS